MLVSKSTITKVVANRELIKKWLTLPGYWYRGLPNGDTAIRWVFPHMDGRSERVGQHIGATTVGNKIFCHHWACHQNICGRMSKCGNCFP